MHNNKYCIYTEWRQGHHLIILHYLWLYCSYLLYLHRNNRNYGRYKDADTVPSSYHTWTRVLYWWLKSLKTFYPRNLISLLFILLPAIFCVYRILWFIKKPTNKLLPNSSSRTTHRTAQTLYVNMQLNFNSPGRDDREGVTRGRKFLIYKASIQKHYPPNT